MKKYIVVVFIVFVMVIFGVQVGVFVVIDVNFEWVVEVQCWIECFKQWQDIVNYYQKQINVYKQELLIKMGICDVQGLVQFV